MNFILSYDYELYGDGSGDIFNHIIHPTSKILRLCDNYNIKTTIFFEVIEYIKIKNEWDSGNNMGYSENPVEAIENQLISAILNGHDIQLHIHPQWIDANYRNNKWHVDFTNWRLGDFTHNNFSIERLLRLGKETIEDLIIKVKPNYRCIALRAGGYNIMPSKDVYNAMCNLDLKIDSSVYPGGFKNDSLNKYDYRYANINKDYWFADPDDFSTEKKNSKIIEIPIFALKTPFIHKLNIERILSFLQQKKSASKNIKTQKTKKNIFDIFKTEALTWDFCLFNKFNHLRFLKFINSNLKKSRKNFIIIGHPKSLTKLNSFRFLIDKIISQKHKFITISDLYYNIISNENY